MGERTCRLPPLEPLGAGIHVERLCERRSSPPAELTATDDASRSPSARLSAISQGMASGGGARSEDTPAFVRGLIQRTNAGRDKAHDPRAHCRAAKLAPHAFAILVSAARVASAADAGDP